MKESPELEALVRRIFKAMFGGKDAVTLENLTHLRASPNGGLRVILAAEDEWFNGATTEKVVQRVKEIGVTAFEFDSIEAYQRGDVGWFAVNVLSQFANHDPAAGHGDYIRITVNKAARITSAAEPGEVMLSSVTAEMATGRRFGLGSSRTVELKGLPGSHRLTQLVGRADENTR